MERQEIIKRRRRSDTGRPLPHAPVFTNELPQEVRVADDQNLVLSVGVDATPKADVKWTVNGFELKESKQVMVMNEEDHSTLVVQPPVRHGRYGVSAKNEYGMTSLTTYVHREEEEQYEQIEEETIIREKKSIAPEFQDGSVTVETETAGVVSRKWDEMDEHKRSSKTVKSREIIESTKKTVTEEGMLSEVKEEYHAEPVEKFTFVQKSLGKRMVQEPFSAQRTVEKSEVMREEGSEELSVQPTTVGRDTNIWEETAAGISKTTYTATRSSVTEKTREEEERELLKKLAESGELAQESTATERRLVETNDAKKDTHFEEARSKTVFTVKRPVSATRTTEVEERGVIEMEDIIRVPAKEPVQTSTFTERKWEEISGAKSEVIYKAPQPLAIRKTEEEEQGVVEEKEIIRLKPAVKERKWVETTSAEVESTYKALPSEAEKPIESITERKSDEIVEREKLARLVAPVEPIHGETFTERRWEEVSTAKSVTKYEAPPPVPPKPVTPVIHESRRESAVVTPVMQDTVMVTSIVRSQPHETTTVSADRFVDETSAKQDRTYVQPTVTQTTRQDRFEEIIAVKQESIYAQRPELEEQVEKIAERRTFHIKPRTVTEPLPKRPFILKQPESEIHLKAKEKLVLEAKVDSYPESQFKWYQNNFEVKPSPQVKIEHPALNESRATFTRPTSGTYKFVASNIHGSCSSSTRVITEVTEDYAEESTITIVRVAEKQEPRYQLTKRPRVGRADLPKKPKIVASFAPVLHVPETEPLILRAVAEAIPEAEFTWLLNNFEVRPSQTVAIEQLGPNTSQATFRVPVSGRYEVIARNKLGQDVRSCKVLIEYKREAQVTPPTRAIVKSTVPRIPVFIKPLPGETQLMPGESEFNLSVGVRGEQPLTFRWFADGSLLSNSVTHQMINDLETSTLVVRETIRCDVDYAIEVSNIHGAVWSETTVKPASIEEEVVSSPAPEVVHAVVRQGGPPRFITSLTSLELNEEDRFTARVEVDHNTAPCEFSWTLNGRDARMLPGIRVESEPYQSTLYVQSVKPKHAGEMMVIARNKFGSAKSSAMIVVEPCKGFSIDHHLCDNDLHL